MRTERATNLWLLMEFFREIFADLGRFIRSRLKTHIYPISNGTIVWISGWAGRTGEQVRGDDDRGLVFGAGARVLSTVRVSLREMARFGRRSGRSPGTRGVGSADVARRAAIVRRIEWMAAPALVAASGCLTPLAGLEMYTQEGSGESTDAAESTVEDGSSDADTALGTGSTAGEICGDGVCELDEQDCEQDCGPPVVCGDGVVDGEEACDDGNQDSDDGCDDRCELTEVCGDDVCTALEYEFGCSQDCGTCGDGVVEAFEQCDAGVLNSEDGACLPTCVSAVCGDGFVQAPVDGVGGEQCDDGNNVADDGCSPACTCVCGDGVLCAGVEQCDAGEANGPGASCTPTCRDNVCGDGYAWAGVEECDDGDDGVGDDRDECSDTCYSPRYAFVTSLSFAAGGNLGGVSGADAKCMALAAQGQGELAGRMFKAWITGKSEGTSPWARIRDSDYDGWYKLLDGSTLGASRGWAGLTSGTLQTAITVSEKNLLVTNDTVWTNTDAQGRIRSEVDHCEGWTTKEAVSDGGIGAVKETITDSRWTSYISTPCSVPSRIYCFEVRN